MYEYIPSFIRIGSGIQQLIGGIHKQTHRPHGDCTGPFLFFQNKGSKLKINCFETIYVAHKMESVNYSCL
jgi:hypothetical protein